jgi:6-phosphogluconolactonase
MNDRRWGALGVLLGLWTSSACGAGGSGSGEAGRAGAAGGVGLAGTGGNAAGTGGSAGSGSAGSSGAGSSGAGNAGVGGSSAGTAGSGGAGGAPGTERAFAYVGSWENAIYVYSLDLASGALSARGGPVDATPSPSFLAFAPDGGHLYAVNEADNVDGTGAGAVSAFRVDAATGGLVFQNRVSSGGAGPAHVAVDGSGKFVFVANYNGGNFSVLPIGGDGTLGAALATQAQGGGAQTHEVVLDASNRFLFVVNKGRSDVAQYRFDAATGALTPNAPAELDLAQGAGSRHLAFHPTLPYAYVVNELDDTVSVAAFDTNLGTLSAVQTLSTLPSGVNGGQNSGAEIQVAPSGRFVYASNRGNDSIVIYSVDAGTGRLTLVGHQPTGGLTPRSFHLERRGELMLVANQDSDEVVTFRVDTTAGTLTELSSVTVPSPAYVGVLFAVAR